MNLIVSGKPVYISMKEITDKRFIRTYRSAGLTFICKYMKYFLINLQGFDDKTIKDIIIDEIYNKGKGFDIKKTGTRTRVYCLLKIIYSGRIQEVLQVAINSKWLVKNKPETVKIANNLLERIIF